MQLIIKGLLAAFWLIFVPGAAGVPYRNLKNKKYSPLGESLLTGYLFMFCAAELIILPATYFKLSLNVTAGIFAGVMLLSAVWGVYCLRGQAGERAWRVKEWIRGTSPWFWLAVVMIAVQIFIAVFYAHMDADDAFYVGTASTAVETNTVFSIDPYTGAPYKRLPRRYVLSPFPVLLGIISRLCGGLHPAVVAHVVYPAVFLTAVYLCFYYMSVKWFPKDWHSQGIFLVFAAVVTWFSGFSVYTAGNFTLIRIWQGKALLTALLLPFTFYLSWCILMEKESSYSLLLLLMANLACCHVSSMGIMLSPIMIGIFAVMGMCKNRSFGIFVKGILCCVPSIFLGVLYLLL